MKVKYLGCDQMQVNWGDNDDPRGLLTVGEVYTVERTEVHTQHTKIKLVGIKGKFNSACFEDVAIDDIPKRKIGVVGVVMTSEQHKQRHVELHKAFDELLADWIRHNPDKFPSMGTVLELMEWSYKQTINPTEVK